MGQRFRQKVVVVTGASAGIGRATAAAFSRDGARVVLGARRKEPLEEAAASLRRGGREARAIPCNVTVPAQVQRLVDAAVDRWDRLDVIVANAGVGLAGAVAETSREDFRHVVDINLIGAWNTIAAALPIMLRQGSGHVVIVSSVLGYRGVPGYAGYCSTKAALVGLSEGLRTEVEPAGLRVTLACPGLTATEFSARRLGPADAAEPSAPVRAMSAEAVGQKIVNAVARGRKRVVISSSGRFLVFMARHFPRLTDAMLANWHGRAERSRGMSDGSAVEPAGR